MKNVVALFSEAADAEKALKKLSDAGLDIDKARIHSASSIERSKNVRAMPSSNAGIAAGSGPTGATGATAGSATPGAFLSDDNIESYLSGIGVDGEEIAFYSHGIKEGGHIVLISVSNDEADKAQKILAEAGGRAPRAE